MNERGNRPLHSRYNPRGEAERYIEALNFDRKPRFFILIEPGLGYMVSPLKKKVPDAKIIALHAGAAGTRKLSGQGPEAAPDAEWFPGTEITLHSFLEREIPDSGAGEIRVIEWRPALNVYGAAYLSLVEKAAEFIKGMDANVRTTKAFGPVWFKNFFRNINTLRNFFLPPSPGLPVLVTGAGPGLEDALPFIREFRNGLYLLASASSVPALKAGSLIPDMVISTDGGNWAAFHLRECFRNGSRPLAAALCAALPSQCASAPVLPLSDGSRWQTLILEALGIPFVVLPQRGTVSAAALDLAFALTKREVIIAGVDLENRDIRSHARPYCFDMFLEEKAVRLNPFYSQKYRRSSLLKAGGAYAVYASWFERQLAAYPKRLYSLGKNHRVFNTLAGPPAFARENPLPRNFKTVTLRFAQCPGPAAFSLLENALDGRGNNSAGSSLLFKELAALLFPGQAGLSREELCDAMRSLVKPLNEKTRKEAAGG